MDETVKCPACQETIGSDSRFCRSCGRKILPCPSCGSPLLEGVMFCVECEARVPRAERDPGDSYPKRDSETPYLVWEGFPFSWLYKTSQTRSQWRVFSWIVAVFVSVYVGFFTYVLATEELSEGETCCLSSIIIIVAFFTVFLMWVRYWVGRRGAEYEMRTKWKEP